MPAGTPARAAGHAAADAPVILGRPADNAQLRFSIGRIQFKLGSAGGTRTATPPGAKTEVAPDGAYQVCARPGADGADDRDDVPARAGVCGIRRRDHRDRDGHPRVRRRDRAVRGGPRGRFRDRLFVLLRQDRAQHRRRGRGQPAAGAGAARHRGPGVRAGRHAQAARRHREHPAAERLRHRAQRRQVGALRDHRPAEHPGRPTSSRASSRTSCRTWPTRTSRS